MGNPSLASVDTPPPAPPPPALPAKGTATRFRMGRTVSALILREMASRYGRSPGGYIWAVLEPIGMIAILSVGFALVVKSPPLGTSFLLFFGTGFTPFNLYTSVSNPIARTFIFSKALLAYPIVSWVDAILARFILNTLTGVMVTYLVLSAIIIALDDPILIDPGPVVEAIALATLLSLSIGTFNCALIGLVRVWEQVWSIVNRPLFLISGIFFLYDDMPPLAQDILWYNPLLHIVGLMRTGFYPTYEASYFSATYVITVCLITLFFGVTLLRRHHRDILSN